MRGQTMPSYEYLEVLVDWLNLDLESVFKPEANPLAKRIDSDHIDVFMALPPQLQESVIQFLRCIPKASEPANRIGFCRSNAVI